MSVIVSRALPEIDGFKPAHRKLLYTMYEMGLLKGNRTKSANIVGSTMHLTPTATRDLRHDGPHGPLQREPACALRGLQGELRQGVQRDMAYAAAVTPRLSSSRSATSCSATSTRTPSILCPTTTARRRSRRCCPSPSRRFWPTTRWHRRRHGVQHLLLQPRGTLQCDDCPDEGPAGRFAGNHSGT